MGSLELTVLEGAHSCSESGGMPVIWLGYSTSAMQAKSSEGMEICSVTDRNASTTRLRFDVLKSTYQRRVPPKMHRAAR